jgi:hypothetical protein
MSERMKAFTYAELAMLKRALAQPPAPRPWPEQDALYEEVMQELWERDTSD